MPRVRTPSVPCIYCRSLAIVIKKKQTPTKKLSQSIFRALLFLLETARNKRYYGLFPLSRRPGCFLSCSGRRRDSSRCVPSLFLNRMFISCAAPLFQKYVFVLKKKCSILHYNVLFSMFDLFIPFLLRINLILFLFTEPLVHASPDVCRCAAAREKYLNTISCHPLAPQVI